MLHPSDDPKQIWHLHKINKDSPYIPYLTFADDSIIFRKATGRAARIVKQALDHYYTVSGQLVNYRKSKVRFHKSVSNSDKKEMA